MCNLDKLATQGTQDVREDRKQKSQKCNLDKLATQGTQDDENKTKTKHNMCWTPLCVNKHTSRE